jgi:hypothetical protein
MKLLKYCSAGIIAAFIGSVTLVSASYIIPNGSVTTAKIASQAVTSAKIANGAVGSTQIASLGVATSNIANNAVTRTQLASVGQQISTPVGSFTTSSGSFVPVTGLSVTITTSGRPVMVFLQPDGTTSSGLLGITSSSITTQATGSLNVKRGATLVFTMTVGGPITSASAPLFFPLGLMLLDTPSAGTYTYAVQAATFAGAGTPSFSINDSVLVAYEL